LFARDFFFAEKENKLNDQRPFWNRGIIFLFKNQAQREKNIFSFQESGQKEKKIYFLFRVYFRSKGFSLSEEKQTERPAAFFGIRAEISRKNIFLFLKIREKEKKIYFYF
jgi:hypothetical protein